MPNPEPTTGDGARAAGDAAPAVDRDEAAAGGASSTATASPRRRLIQTSAGTSAEAFGRSEWGLLAFVASVWGSSFLWMEIGLEAFAPGVVTLARVGLGAGALALFPRARRPVERDDWPRLVLLGLVWTGIPLTLFPIAQQWIDSALAGMINAALPLTSAAWATVLLRRLPGRTQLVGLAVGFAGIVAISAPEVGGGDSSALGVALVLVAVFLYGLAANLAVPLQQRYGALPVILRSQTVAAVFVLPFGLYGLGDSTFAWGPALAMLPLGVLGTGLAFVAMTTLVGRVGGARGTVAIYFVPLVAIVLGVWVRDETVTAAALVGTVLVVAGAWITSRRERRRRPRAEARSDPGPGVP
jgi:drug/metabolite transporter (DMT)-like permease